MNVDSSTFLTRYAVAIDALNRGDLDPLGALLADTCDWTTSGGSLGTNPTTIIDQLRDGLTNGWIGHRTLSMITAGEFIVGTFRNDFEGGTHSFGAGVIQLNADGQVVTVRTLEQT